MKTTKNDEEHWVKELAFINDIYASTTHKMPVHYILSLTNACNLNCPFCFLSHNVENELNFDDWLSIIDQLPPYARVVFFGGEPLIYKNFNKLFQLVANKFSSTIVTNGTLLDESKIDILLQATQLKNIFISIDSIGNLNRNFTSKQWQQLVSIIDHFNKKRASLKSSPRLGINTVILDETADDLFKLHKFCHEQLHCDYMNYCLLNGASMQLSDVMQNFDNLFINESSPGYHKWDTVLQQLDLIMKYNRANRNVSYFRPKYFDINSNSPLDNLKDQYTLEQDDAYGPCKIPWADCRIHPDGNVSPCLAISYGNVKDRSLKEILQSPIADKFKNHLRHNRFFPQCNRCVMRYHKNFSIE